MFGYGKKNRQKQAASTSSSTGNETGLLYYKVGKDGVVTNFQAWLRGWKEHKIMEYDVTYQEGLREYKREEFDLDGRLRALEYEPLVTISKDFWVPTTVDILELEAESDTTRRGYVERRLMAQWARTQAIRNAEIQARNDATKKKRDEIIAIGNDTTRKNTITTLMGKVLGDMTAESRRMVMKWQRTDPKDPNDPESALKADTMDEAYQLYDWLFVFEAAMVTHLHADCTVDATTVLERQERALNKLKNLKHEAGSLQAWLQRYDDVIEECETMGATVTDETKRIYMMKNLNEKIFEQTLILWRGVLTRASFPQTYDALKAYVSNEYSSQMTQNDRAQIIYSVISQSKKKNELSLLGMEKNGGKDKNKCFLCDRQGHKMKKCWYYDATKTLEENKKVAMEKIKEKQEAKRKKKEEGKQNTPEATKTEKETEKGVPHKGTVVQLPPKTEKSGMCLVTNAELFHEPCYTAGVRSGQVDFIYDSGTVSGVMGAKEIEILKNVSEEDVLIETVTGEKSISKLYGDTIFGKTRIVKGRRGSVLVSQYATKHMYQVINPDEDTFVLRGWDHNPKTKGKIWYFVRDEKRYDDKLLHCTVDVEVAKSFGITNESKFYDPAQMNDRVITERNEKNSIIDTMHNRYQHASANELKRVLEKTNGAQWQNITAKDIDIWANDKGRFCSGCVEGKLKEHARKKSTKPLTSQTPGEVTVGDIMFVELKNNIKKPLLVHVDVYTKLITGIPLLNKTEMECTKAVLDVKAEYLAVGHNLHQLVFDRDPGIVPAEGELKKEGIVLMLKAAGQKVGLAEVTIRLIREKARATKAGVRAKYGYLPPNQFNMDLCLDAIDVLNRIPKVNMDESPYESFARKEADVIRDFRTEWGELIVVKKPKGIASDLGVTGQWAMVVRRIMNATGVLKVYLIQTKKYAYRLHFARALAPEWVLEKLHAISADESFGFENGVEDDLREIVLQTDVGTKPTEVVEEIIDIEDNQDEMFEHMGKADIITKTIESVEEVWHDNTVKAEIKMEEENKVEIEEFNEKEGEVETSPISDRESQNYVTRSGRISRPPQRLIETAYGVVREIYDFDSEQREKQLTLEATHMMKALLFQKALKKKPKEAMNALREEVKKSLKIDIWEPVHLKDLTTEEQELIIPQMANYLEKYKPDATFDKYKVRVLTRGDKQFMVGETEGPVARIESLLMLLGIAIHEDLVIFKVDIGSAFMRTPMVDDVKHKWVKLHKLVVQVLLELEPEKYEPYVLPDGTVVVKMKKISYGYAEAAHYWWKNLTSTFRENGYIISKKDKCVFIKREAGRIAICGTTVDDCLFISTRDDAWVDEQIKMLQNKYEEVTVESGDELGVIGMQVKMLRTEGKVELTQPKHVDQIIQSFNVTKGAPNPALAKLMDDDENSPLLTNQKEFMSKCAMLMYVSQRTYPEIRPAVIKLSTKYNKATELDNEKALRVAEYIYGTRGVHRLVLDPKTLNLVCTADASYAEHVDGRSHSGGTVGFESETSCNFAFVSSKQPVVAKSAGEAELIAQNKVGDMVEWAREMLQELGFEQGKVPMHVDSTCAIQMIKQGTGSFKRAKHIKVRFFWMKELIDQGYLELIYTPTEELVADILTKPLTGLKFQLLLYKLLGWSTINTKTMHDLSIAEEVCWSNERACVARNSH